MNKKQLFNEQFSSIVLLQKQADPPITNYQGLSHSVYQRGFRIGFSIGLGDLHLFNSRTLLMSLLVWVSLPDNTQQSSVTHILSLFCFRTKMNWNVGV